MKYNADGSVNWYKAWLVVKGYALTHGVDYEETYGPVVKMTTIQTVLTLVATKGWHLHQTNVKNAFLQCDLEEVYNGATSPNQVDHTPTCCMLT